MIKMNSKKILIMMITIIFGSVFALFGVNAVQDFTVSTTSVSQTVNVSTSNTFTIDIESTGNESINLDLSHIDLTNGSNTIVLNLDKEPSINNLENGSTSILTTTYDAGEITGIYTGSITIENADNSSQSETIDVSITVNSVTSPNIEGASITFDEPSPMVIDIDVDDSSQRKTFVLKNNGDVKLNDVEIDLDSRFYGDDDDISDDDFEINGNDGDQTYSLKDDDDVDFLGVDETYDVELYLRIPSNLDVDDYRGDIKISYIPEGSTVRESESFSIKIVATSDNEDVYFEEDTLYVRNKILTVLAEPDETVNDIEFTVRNDASYDVQDITFDLDSDLEEENSASILPKSAITFTTTSLDIYDRDSEDVKFDLVVPKDQPVGTYTTDINLYSSTGKKLDKMTLEIKISGDVYIDSIDFDPNVEPGSYLDVPIVVKNKGATTQRNVRIKGSLFDIDSANTDIYESSSNFLLETDATRTETLRFKIPKDASDGSHVLEITVEYDDNTINQIENIEVTRPTHKIDLTSYAVNPTYAKCQDTIYTYAKFQNLGKYDEDVTVTSEIENTNIKQSTNTLDLGVDEIMQKSLVLDISNLDPGTYNVIQRVNYAGNAYEQRESSLVISSCNKGSIEGIDIKDINDTNLNESSTNSTSNNVEVFGHKMTKTTAYLSAGIGTTTLLIVLALFLI